MEQIKKKKKKLKFGRWFLLLIVIVVLFNGLNKKKITIHENIVIEKGDNFSKFTKDFGFVENTLLKLYIKKNGIDLSKIAIGSYFFSGEYTKSEFVNIILAGPQQNYQKYTVLEGWSIYDIDYDLSKKGLIETGKYLSFVSDISNINNYKNLFGFLQGLDLKSLEGFLYPDTYNIDVGKDFLTQLVKLQLQNFDNRVRKEYEDQIKNFGNKLSSDGFDALDWYETLTLATIVEKEERLNSNKSVIAGLFLNRLDNGMRLDADISLCYGLHQPYEICTPDIIVKNLYDEKNIYNTRQVGGIPPNPICNPSVDTIKAVLNYEKSDYFFYLHDNNGQIHFGKSVEEHNRNKSLYVK